MEAGLVVLVTETARCSPTTGATGPLWPDSLCFLLPGTCRIFLILAPAS